VVDTDSYYIALIYNENVPDTLDAVSLKVHYIIMRVWVKIFWKGVKEMIEKFLDVNIPLSPLLFYFLNILRWSS